MITLFDGVIPGGIVGCQIKTLMRCYSSIQNAADLYKSDSGGVMCRFGQTLLLCGECDANELFDFAETLGVTTIEAQMEKAVCLAGWTAEKHPVLCLDCSGGSEIPFLRLFKDCYEVICLADESFARETEYLYWLSDVTRRQNLGCSKVYHRDGSSAVVSASADSEAYLSLVATLPEKRGEGRAAALLRDLISDSFLCGKRLFTAAQSGELIPFYQRLGFLRLDQSLIIFKKEHI